MKTYPKYKESGIPWMGKIPEEWDKCRFKMLHFGTNVGEAIDKTYWTDDENDTVFYTAGVKPIHTNYPDFPVEKITKEEDILLARNGTPYVFLPSVHAAYTDHIIRASILPSVNKVYVSYALAVAILHVAVDSVSLPTWSASLWNAQVLPVPSLAEQQAIAEYLDKKTGDIDELVGLLNKQIADVRAYRQSLITETVTQGLNKDVPMKDSGIEWIGQIPKAWKVLKLKHVSEICGRIGYRGYTALDLVGQGEGAITLSPSNIQDNKMTYQKCSYLSWNKYEESPEIQVHDGDILFTKTGSSYGKSAYVNYLPKEATINPQLIVIKCKNSDSKFVSYILQTSIISTQVELSVVGGTIPTISQEAIGSYHLPIPSLSEQQQIVEFLDAKTKDIDELLSKLEAQVADLLAYKSSLISEVVTGKIDIR